MFFRNIMLAFASPTVDHRNLLGLGISTDSAAEAARQAHQVIVVQGLIGTRQSPPPQTEAGGIVAHPIVAIQYDAIDAIVTASQKVPVNAAQLIRHASK